MDKQKLNDWVLEGIKYHGGEATIVEVAQYIWENHQEELRRSGDLFFTWQYDMRWAADNLRRQGKLRATSTLPRGKWAV